MGKYYRHPKFGRVYGNTLKTPIGRLCWPALSAPKEDTFNGQTTSRYGCTILLPKEDGKSADFIEKLNNMLDEEGGMLEIFNEHADVNISLSSDVLKDGDTFDMEKYPYYKGNYVLLARNEKPVPVYGASGKDDILEPSVIVGGVLGRCIVTPHLGPSGVSFKLDAVQFWKDDGTKFGGAGRNLDAFLDAIEGVEDEYEESQEDMTPEIPETYEEPRPVAPRGRGRPPKAAQMAPDTIRDRIAAATQKTGVPVSTARPGNVLAMRANQASAVKGVTKVPANAKVVTTGKGKALALDNL